MLEIGYAQGHAVSQLLEQTGIFAEIKIEKDHQNNDRVIVAKRAIENALKDTHLSEETR
jgi:methylase of polypeptide subunit release factors